MTFNEYLHNTPYEDMNDVPKLDIELKTFTKINVDKL